MFVRALQGTPDLTKNTVKHWVYWLGSVFIVVIVAYIIASAVPVFSGLLGVIGALFCAWLCVSFPSLMWFYDKWSERKTNKSWGYRLVFAWNVFQVLAGFFIMIAGVSRDDGQTRANRQLIRHTLHRHGEASSKSETPTTRTVARSLSHVTITVTPCQAVRIGSIPINRSIITAWVLESPCI